MRSAILKSAMVGAALLLAPGTARASEILRSQRALLVPGRERNVSGRAVHGGRRHTGGSVGAPHPRDAHAAGRLRAD